MCRHTLGLCTPKDGHRRTQAQQAPSCSRLGEQFEDEATRAATAATAAENAARGVPLDPAAMRSAARGLQT